MPHLALKVNALFSLCIYSVFDPYIIPYTYNFDYNSKKN